MSMLAREWDFGYKHVLGIHAYNVDLRTLVSWIIPELPRITDIKNNGKLVLHLSVGVSIVFTTSIYCGIWILGDL